MWNFIEQTMNIDGHAMPPAPGQDAVESLRATIARLERGRAPAERLPLGVKAIDAVLNGGLKRGAVHDFVAESMLDQAAACAFAFFIAQKTQGKPIVWLGADGSAAETGQLYGHGLVAHGVDPARVIFVQAATARDLLWAAEEALRTQGVGLILIEAWGVLKSLDLSSARRLCLAAEEGGGLGVFLRDSNGLDPPFATRWSIAAAPSPPEPGSVPGRACLDLSLVRNRLGPTGRWRILWNHESRSFSDAGRALPTLSQPLVSAPAGGSHLQEIKEESAFWPGHVRRVG
jgi:protein ImuA